MRLLARQTELPILLASRIGRKPMDFKAFSPLSHLPDGLVKVEGSDWCQRSEIPQKATPNPRIVSGRRANIRSGHIGSRFIIPRIGGRMKVADHLYGAHLGERRPEQQGDADFTPLDFLLFLEAVHGIAVSRVFPPTVTNATGRLHHH
jgi:hypothetical protein